MHGTSEQAPFRIVVANDDPYYLQMMREVLSDYGYDVRTCITIDEGYECVSTLLPDLVIVDLLFPGTKQGIDLVTMMRLKKETQNIPVIICSAATKALREMEDHLRAQNLTTLYKPFHIDELITAIQQLERGSSSEDQAEAAQ
jgi:DNA-binding response OmpR family regulator